MFIVWRAGPVREFSILSSLGVEVFGDLRLRTNLKVSFSKENRRSSFAVVEVSNLALIFGPLGKVITFQGVPERC